jgi:hypothetical protein
VKIKIYALTCIAICCGEHVYAQFASGSGTEFNPFIITTPEHLDNLHTFCSLDGCAGKYFKMSQDINVYDYIRQPDYRGGYGGAGCYDSLGWRPIGTLLNPFMGNFSGGGYRITGLWMRRSTNNAGLFGCTEGAEIAELGVDVCSWEHIKGNINVGALVGYMKGGIIKKCHASGSEVIGERNVGGLVGYMEGGSIEQCYTAINVTSQTLSGGFVGKMNGATSTSAASITDSYAVNYIVSANANSADTVGGFIGHVIGYCLISRCFSGVHKFVLRNNINTHIGAFVGRFTTIGGAPPNPFTYCYWNTDLLGNIQDVPGSPNATTRLTTEEMSLQSYFQSYDFSNVWSICPPDDRGVGHSYPYFEWQRAIQPQLVVTMNPNNINPTTIELRFTILAPADSFMYVKFRDGVEYDVYSKWAMCDSRSCNPPYNPYVSMNIWTFVGTPDIGLYYYLTTKASSNCTLRESKPAVWISPQRPASASIDIKQSLGQDTFMYGQILPSMQPLITKKSSGDDLLVSGDVMKANYVLQRVNNYGLAEGAPQAYNDILNVGRYWVSIDTTSIMIFNSQGQDVSKYYNVRPRSVTPSYVYIVKAPTNVQIHLNDYPGFGSPTQITASTNRIPQTPTACNPDNISFVYKECSQIDFYYTNAIPATKGCYIVKAMSEVTPFCQNPLMSFSNYEYGEDTMRFVIGSMQPLEIAIDTCYVGCVANPSAVFNACVSINPTYYWSTRTATCHAGMSNDNTCDWRNSTIDRRWAINPPTNQGNYVLMARIAAAGGSCLTQGGSYTTVNDAYFNFEINAKITPIFDFDMTIPITKTYDHNPADTPTIRTNSDGNVSFKYKPRLSPDSFYDTISPSDAGNYTVRAILEATCKFDMAERDRNFTIYKAKGTLVVAQDTGIYGWLPDPVYSTNNTDSDYVVTFGYKKRTEPDSLFRNYIGSQVGLYSIRGVLGATLNYSADTTIVNFVIVKAPGHIVLQQPDGYFTRPLPPPDTLSNNSCYLYEFADDGSATMRYDKDTCGAISYLYKQGTIESDNYFELSKPTNAGYFVIRAILAETDNYTAATTDVIFKIIDTICTDTSKLIALRYWENLILVNLNYNTNGGYSFDKNRYYWRWTHNAKPLHETSIPYYYLPHVPKVGDRYMIFTTTAAGDSIYDCLVVTNPQASEHKPAVKKSVSAWIYPNPVAVGQSLTIETNEGSINHVEIYNVNGQLLQQHIPTGTKTDIIVRSLPAGIYMVKYGSRAAAVAVRE